MDIRLFLGAIGLGLAATQAPAMMANINANSAAVEAAKARNERTKGLAAEELSLANEAKIADKRYREGCTMVNVLKSPTVGTAIIEGEGIVNGAYAHLFNLEKPNPGHFIGPKTTVCDPLGTTAILAFSQAKGYAVAGSIAVTRNQSAILVGVSRAKALRGGKYSVPTLANPNQGKK